MKKGNNKMSRFPLTFSLGNAVENPFFLICIYLYYNAPMGWGIGGSRQEMRRGGRTITSPRIRG